jgi:hypothetical protein
LYSSAKLVDRSNKQQLRAKQNQEEFQDNVAFTRRGDVYTFKILVGTHVDEVEVDLLVVVVLSGGEFERLAQRLTAIKL